MFDIFKIFDFLKKTFKRKDVIIILSIVALYFATRLTNLTLHPIFSDEGIYIHWAKVAWHDASWRFISLTDGKQPLQTWATIPFLKFFPDDMLLAGRLFATLGGFISLSGLFTLLHYLYGKKTAYWGSFLYILTPYFLFYERLALVDSYVTAGVIWIFFLSILMVRERRLETSLIFGALGGLFLLAKSSVQMFIGLSALAPILIFEKKFKSFFRNSLSYFILLGLGAVIANLIYNIQRLSPFMHYVAEKNLTFIMSFPEFLETPFKYFFHNLGYVPLYFSWESGFMLTLIALVGLVILAKRDFRLFTYLVLWIVAPYIVVSFFMKVLFPRYIIFFGGLSLIAAASAFHYLSDKWKKILFALFLMSVIYFDYTIIFAPAKIPFPEVDRGQYIEGWPAGWGIKEFMEEVRTESKSKPVIILAEGNFGMASDVLQVFLKREDEGKITVKGYWPLGEEQLRENIPLLEDNKVYVFFSHEDEFPANWPLVSYKTLTKPGNKSNFRIFELTSAE
jgi:4-amino-4-deoxy-L-arabinose transferase-like glycosyltransferase